jgi:acylphosphatase
MRARRVGNSTAAVKSEAPLESWERYPYTFSPRGIFPRHGENSAVAADAEQHEIHYSGDVQGVGFRYTVRSLASRLAVAGFVKNLSDGRVQLVVEGSPAEIQLLLSQIRTEMGRYIWRADEQIRPATGRFKSFDVRF